VLAPSDEPIRTWIRARGAWRSFQEFMIRERCAGPIDDVAFRPFQGARAAPEALEALAEARAVVIGPSNPVL